ncbi:MAG TPA: amidohydrolase family protein [Candidatus Binatia bacterium]
MKFIDADAHVEESDEMWKLLDPAFASRRPIPMALPEDTWFGRYNAFWLIDGEIFPKMNGRVYFTFGTPPISQVARSKAVGIPSQTLTDVAERLKDLDTMGIDTQVVFPTLFLAPVCEDVAYEAALCRAYNDFMGSVSQKSGGRIRWAAVLPLRDTQRAAQEINRVKAQGAVTVLLLSFIWDLPLDSWRFFPFYEACAAEHFPLSIHLGWGSPSISRLFDSRTQTRYTSSANSVPLLMAFNSMTAGGVLDDIPGLRASFLEIGCEWVQYSTTFGNRRRRAGEGRAKKPLEDYFREGQIYVSCEPDEDLPYVMKRIGSDCLMLATDYPHEDPMAESHLLRDLMKREDLSEEVKNKILVQNPARFYGL